METDEINRDGEPGRETARTARILLIEDDPDVIHVTGVILGRAGYEFDSFSVGRDGLAAVSVLQPDLVILDVGLPDIDGFEICRRIREHSSVPVLMLTGRSAEQDAVAGLAAGADDYVRKPFRPQEFMARIEALLRRAARPAGPVGDGDIVVDPARRRAEVRGLPVTLTKNEYRLLLTLVRNRGRVMTHREIVEEIWGPDGGTDRHILRVLVGRLRQKIETDPSAPTLLRTEQGVGYILHG